MDELDEQWQRTQERALQGVALIAADRADEIPALFGTLPEGELIDLTALALSYAAAAMAEKYGDEALVEILEALTKKENANG